MGYERIETVHPIPSRRRFPTVPTIVEVITAIRANVYGSAVANSDGARCLEAGTRLTDDATAYTEDATLWAEDSDLFDFVDLVDVLKQCRRDHYSHWPKELDLYVRDTEELLGNVDLRPSPDGWTLVSVTYRKTTTTEA